MQIKSFEPIIDKKSTVLILGTMPGVASLTANQYYGHPNNIFWDIIFRVCSQDWKCDEVVSADYDFKRTLLLENDIALWDVLKFCDRKGSLDRDILKQVYNDFEFFFYKYPNIKTVFFNGSKAAEYFQEFKGRKEICSNRTFLTLQSTSPTNTTNSFYILNQWKQAIIQVLR